MSYPTKYTRQYDYVSYQNANPSRPLPATSVHADLNQVALSTSEIVEFLKTSLRADGAIANGAVGIDQLSTAVAAQLGDASAVQTVLDEAQAAVDAAEAAVITAASSASAASTSATSASNSVTAATTSATNAASSATAAAASASDAASSAASIPVYSSRTTLAAATVSPTTLAVACLGYTTSGDCSPFMVKRVALQPRFGGVRSTDRYLPNGSTDATNGGWWVYVPGPAGVDACAFGLLADWNGVDASATDNTTALQNAISFASQSFGTGYDTAGGGGSDVLLPSGTVMISSLITLHDGVRLLGKGTYGTVLKMKDTFSTTSHFIRLGTAGDVSAVCASQTKGSAGDLTINGTLAASGVAYFLQKRQPAIYSAGNDSARTFTVYGTDETGASINASVAGANVGRADVPDLFLTITRVAVDGATAAAVTVGFQTAASFGCRLEQMQLYAGVINASSGMSMVYTDNAQHTGGLKAVKIFGGNRHCARFETGVGGASIFTFEEVETFNQGNKAGVASNNSQIKLNYDGLSTICKNLVVQGPGASGGAAALGIEITGGFVSGSDIHVEGVATGVRVNTLTANNGYTSLRNVVGGAGVTNLVYIDAAVDNNTVMLQEIYSNGSTNTVNDVPGGGASGSINILAQTVY
ncbi:hypothetical protein ACVIIV_005352 [Bradyrhizobium sp. USDA 4354]